MTIRITKPAERDIDSILGYLRKRSAKGARNVRDRLTKVFETLTRHPEMGRAVEGTDARQFVVNPYPYVLYYRQRDDAAEILRILHGAREDAHSPFLGN